MEMAWDKVLKELKELYGVDEDSHDFVATELLKGYLLQQYHLGRLAGITEEASAHRSHYSIPLKA